MSTNHPISLFDLFSIGMGPSSSHSVGPMRAIRKFLDRLSQDGVDDEVSRIEVDLYGSLALTGIGHGTDRAIILAICGYAPETVDPDRVANIVQQVQQGREISWGESRSIEFDPSRDIRFLRRESLDFHPNGMVIRALANSEKTVLEKTYYSVGGGFVVDGDSIGKEEGDPVDLPFAYDSAEQLLELARKHRMAISRIVWENEKSMRPEEEIRKRILDLWTVMKQCVERGCRQTGILPGGLKVERRAAALYRSLQSKYETKQEDPLTLLDWVDLFA
ncbi:MAG: serine dehydratase beta chain, partial [Planctomycetota bacterium]|nr:serine dehydratase beta chain [Planctomycetota bacterium]